MAIFVETNTPQSLVDKIKEAIDQNKIDTWSYDSDGDFTHNVDQWRYNAWIRPIVEDKRVVFAILGRTDVPLSVVDYGVYHGRFVEMLLNHLDSQCSNITVTPMPVSRYDNLGKRD